MYPKEFANPIEAIDAALDPDTPPAEKDPEYDPDPDVAPEPPEEPVAEAEGADDDDAPEGDAIPDEPAGDEPDGDGDDDAAAGVEGAEGEEDDEGKPEEKAEGEDGKGEKEARPSDQFGDLPKDTKKETAERFDKMRKGYDELHGKLESAHTRIDQMVGVIQETGATAEQFNAALAYIKARNTNDPTMLAQAYDTMQAELSAIGKLIGREAPGVDPLEEFPDLAQEVNDGGMTRKYALEIAQARKQSALTGQQREQQQQRQQQESQQQESVATAHRQLAALGQELRTADPEKFAAVLENGQLQTITELVEESGLPHDQWAGKLKQLYDKLPKPAPAAAPAARRQLPPTPIRPGGSSAAPGGGKVHKEPGSAMEAIDMALGI